VAMLASHLRRSPIRTFTIRIPDPRLDETDRAMLVARRIGADPIVVRCGDAEVLKTYPRLIQAAEGPVIDTSSAALLLLAQEVNEHGYKVALSGEGADEWLAGYPWYKIHRVLNWLDFVPGVPLSQLARRAYLRVTGAPRFPWSAVRRIHQAIGGKNAWLEVYGLMGLSRPRFYSPEMRAALADYTAYADLGLNVERMKRWHPLNRSLYLGARIHLSGLLLSGKGDRVAMHSSVETRYPFLDEEVFDFLAPLHPRWKLHGFRDKHLLRELARRWLPPEVAQRPKAMFRAPFDSFHLNSAPTWVNQLLSPESLRKTGYFRTEAVDHWRLMVRDLRAGSNTRVSVEMGLVAVVATQLWHHTFIDGSLADLPSRTPFGRLSLVTA
jgi:asparagine synthase (glutamine-hydrolysing)